MKLADIYRGMREVVRIEEETRQAWQARCVDLGRRMLRDGGLVEAAAEKWLEKAAQDVTAAVLKPSGAMQRVAAGQVELWPEMPAVDGLHALRQYVRKYRRVVSRHEFSARMLGYLHARFESDAELAKLDLDLMGALAEAGASPEDLARLQELTYRIAA